MRLFPGSVLYRRTVTDEVLRREGWRQSDLPPPFPVCWASELTADIHGIRSNSCDSWRSLLAFVLMQVTPVPRQSWASVRASVRHDEHDRDLLRCISTRFIARLTRRFCSHSALFATRCNS